MDDPTNTTYSDDPSNQSQMDDQAQQQLDDELQIADLPSNMRVTTNPNARDGVSKKPTKKKDDPDDRQIIAPMRNGVQVGQGDEVPEDANPETIVGREKEGDLFKTQGRLESEFQNQDDDPDMPEDYS